MSEEHVGLEQEYGFEMYFDTTDGMLFAQSRVTEFKFEITYEAFTLYPVTSAQDHAEVGELMQIFRWLMDNARERGYRVINLRASRKRPGRPRRILNLSRRLQ